MRLFSAFDKYCLQLTLGNSYVWYGMVPSLSAKVFSVHLSPSSDPIGDISVILSQFSSPETGVLSQLFSFTDVEPLKVVYRPVTRIILAMNSNKIESFAVNFRWKVLFVTSLGPAGYKKLFKTVKYS